MATRRFFRRRRVTSSLTDMQTRLTRLETAPKRAALNNNAVGYDQLETNVRAQLDAALAEAQNAAIQASKGILSYRMSEDPTTTRVIGSYSLEFKTATIFTTTDNYYQIGSSVIISGLDPAIDGEHLVTASFYSTDLTKFQIIVDSTATIPLTSAPGGAQAVLVPKEGDEWVDPTAGNETKSWNEVDDKWVKKDPVVEDGAIGVKNDYDTKIRPNRITETITGAKVVEGIVEVTATSHPFDKGDRLDIVLTVGSTSLSKAPAIVDEVIDSNTFTYKIDDLTISIPTVTAPTGSATAKYFLIDGDTWSDGDGVIWTWDSATNSFVKRQDINATQKTQTYYSNADPTTSVSLASFQTLDGTVTITTSTAHYFIPGSEIEITSTSDPELNGIHVVSAVAGSITATGNGTTFTFQMDIEDVGLSSFTGTTAVLKPRLGDKWVDTDDGNKQYVWSDDADGDGQLWQSSTVVEPKNNELAAMTVTRSVDPSTVTLTIDRRSLSKGVVRVRTTSPHGFKAGDRIIVTGFPNSILNVDPGPGYVRGVLNSTEFTYVVPSGSRTLAQANVTASVTVRYFLTVGDSWIDTSNNRNEYKWADTNGDGVGDTWEDTIVTNPSSNHLPSVTYTTSVDPSTIVRTIDQRELSKGVVTVRTTTAHGFSAGDRLTITGFANTILNGSPVFVKQVLSNTQFTYEIPSGSRTLALSGASASASYFFVKNDSWTDPVTKILYVYDETTSSFVIWRDTGIETALDDSAAALAAAESAALAANGKNKIYYLSNEPSVGPFIEGDMWFDTDDNNRIYVYREAMWAAAGDAGQIRTSTDGTAWTTASSNFGTSAVRSIAHAAARWVAVGDGGQIRVSLDKTTWTTRTSGVGSAALNSVVFANNLWVAAGNSGQLVTSTDTATWTSRTTNFGTTNINSVAFGGGTWAAVGAAGTIRTSTDTVSWVTVNSNFGSTSVIISVNTVAFANNTWVAAGDSGQIRTSTNASVWVTRTSNFGSTTIRSIAFGANTWVAVGDGGTLRTSTDAVSWTTQTSNFGASNITSVAYLNNRWNAVGAGGQLRTSTDAVSWVTQTSGFGSTQINSITYAPGLWADSRDGEIAVAQALAGNAQTTADGKSKVYYSLSGPGSTPNNVGDIWFQYNSSQIVIGQFEGLGGTSWRPVTIGDLVIANISAAKINTGILNANLVTISSNGGTSGTRVQMTGTGLYGFSGSTETFAIDTTTGAVRFTGEIRTGSQITGGSININGTFIVTSAGALTASSANITGQITATSGRIGRFNVINDDYILYGNAGLPDLLLAGGNSVSTFAISSLTKGASFTQLQATGGAANAVSVIGGITATLDLTARDLFATRDLSITARSFLNGAIFGSTSSYSYTTTSGQRALYMEGSGASYRVGTLQSSRRYKTDIKSIDLNVEPLLTLPMKNFKYIKDVEVFGDNAPQRYGLIAEEVPEHDSSLEWLVQRDEEGVPDYVNWNEMMPQALLRLAQLQSEQIKSLLSRVEALEAGK